MKTLTILCAPPGAGKTTYRKAMLRNDPTLKYVSQDEMGKQGHLDEFHKCIANGESVVVDRMSFNKQQRSYYLDTVVGHSYHTKIIVLHENQATCLERMLARKGHETIQDEKSARSALHTFFTKYQRPEVGEADEIQFNYPDTSKAPHALIYDLDGTVCDISHRQHHVLKSEGKKPNWRAFFSEMHKDKVNQVVADIIIKYHNSGMATVACSGRPSDYRDKTIAWLESNFIPYKNLFMRPEKDSRHDYIIKEILLDFEILTRYRPFFVLDDRNQVVDLWRRRGLTCLQVAPGDF